MVRSRAGEGSGGQPQGITVELARCETVEVDATEDDGMACESAPRADFPPQRTVTGAGGYWEFPDLMEGWYRVNVGDAGFSPRCSTLMVTSTTMVLTSPGELCQDSRGQARRGFSCQLLRV